MKAAAVAALAASLVSFSWLALARAEGKDGKEEDDDAGGDDDTVVVDDKPKPKPKQQEFKKQDLAGHAVDQSTATNTFEKERFFVDKVDNKKTAQGTLIQGSIASSSFLYTESSGKLQTGGAASVDQGSAASKFSRMFTELRLQTDFRHISGGAWDARIDTRGRFSNDPHSESTKSVTPSHIQSGFNGTNEYEIREAWIVRNGKRTDLFFGRQFVPDLGAVKIDGLRFDYAQSEKLTLLGFGGLYPVRGSRSITTDYVPLRDDNLQPAGRFVGAAGFGAAYRTLAAHGAFGGVTEVPFSSEVPRVYATSNGYYRSSSSFDVYHNAIFDAFGKAAPQLTQLSAGANVKPSQRLRLTGSFNRVDTETLNVQANAFLQQSASPGLDNQVQTDTYLKRLSTNAAKAGVSVALGPLQRFEVSTAVNYRYRPAFTIRSPNGMATVNLDAAKGVDVYLSVTDRHSIASLRLGADVSRSFAVGNLSFQRSEVLALRVFAAREFRDGRGEWEGEIGYSSTKDVAGPTQCNLMMLNQCFGTSNGSIVSIGGNVYYRINRDWFALGNLWINTYGVTAGPMSGSVVADPTIIGLTGFGRIAYRF